MGSITSYSKQIVVFFLALSLFIRPTFASSVGGWSMGNPIAQGASVVYEGTKNIVINGADYIKKGTATITPTAANVAKTLGKGVAGAALSVAVDELLGAVDWVLDPANNQITYFDSPVEGSNYVYQIQGKQFVGPLAACAAFYQISYAAVKVENSKYSINSTGTLICQANVTRTYGAVESVRGEIYRVAVGEAEQPEEKTIPIPSVAETVISNAADGDALAQEAIISAAADIVAEAEADKTGTKARPIAQQLEATSTTKPADADAAATANTATGTQTQNPTKPEVKDIALEFPTFCGWATILCEFAQTANQAIADAKAEYADKPQENTDTELEIPDLEQDIEVDTDISFGGSCPAPLTSQVNFMGINETMEFSFDPLCEIAQFIKPVVISVSAFSAALIVAGIRTEDD